jgi:hypothetical protein
VVAILLPEVQLPLLPRLRLRLFPCLHLCLCGWYW